MANDFFYYSHIRILYGEGKSKDLQEVLNAQNVRACLLICDKMFEGLACSLADKSPQIKSIFSEIKPNPDIADIGQAVQIFRELNCDSVIAIGDGGTIDSAKMVAALSGCEGDILEYFYGKRTIVGRGVKIFAIPTTAGSGSEVSDMAVVNNGDTRITRTNSAFMPRLAIVDPELTYTVPPRQTVITGMDALSHAIEAYWSTKSNPICDLYCVEAARLIVKYLERATRNGYDAEARERLSYASLLAGLAVAQTKGAGVQACASPLSIKYHIPHGEACAFTLPYFIRLNEDRRLDRLARLAGFRDCTEFSVWVENMKRIGGLRYSLSQVGIDVDDIPHLVQDSLSHPLFRNNPGKLSAAELVAMFENIAK